jgi:hypothetical protein
VIAIENKLISDDIIEQQFVCDLNACKGGCCVDGDCGAPLSFEEAQLLHAIYPVVKDDLVPQHIAAIEEQGTYVMDDEYGYVTPTIDGGVCVYAYTDEVGIVKCAIEKAWKEGKLAFQKPISCHLYPIRVKQSQEFELLNYEPRKKMCKPACKLGATLKIPVYKFLQQPLERAYGKEFYQALSDIADQFYQPKN